MKVHSKSKGPRPITIVSDGALWQGKRTPLAFCWIHVMDLPPKPTTRERLAQLVAELPLSAKRQTQWQAVVAKLNRRDAEQLITTLERLTPAARAAALEPSKRR